MRPKVAFEAEDFLEEFNPSEASPMRVYVMHGRLNSCTSRAGSSCFFGIGIRRIL